MNSVTQEKTADLTPATGPTHPRHKGEDVVLLVFDGVFGVLLFTFLRAAKPHRPGLQLLLPPTYVSQAVTAAEKGHDPV